MKNYLKLSTGDVLYSKPYAVSAAVLVADRYDEREDCDYVNGYFTVAFEAGGSAKIVVRAGDDGIKFDRMTAITEAVRKEVTDWCERE